MSGSAPDPRAREFAVTFREFLDWIRSADIGDEGNQVSALVRDFLGPDGSHGRYVLMIQAPSDHHPRLVLTGLLDVAVEIALPDASAGERLLALYGQSVPLALTQQDVRVAVERTDGTMASLWRAASARPAAEPAMGPGPGHGRDPGEALATWWLARGEDQLPSAAGWLSAAERTRAGALRYTKRRTDFLLGRWTLKLAVARALGWPDDPAVLARIEGRTAPTGAPLLYIDGQPADRGVSLTDRAGCAVCLVAAGPAAVGCDVEIVEPRSDAFVRDYLTQAEQRLVAAAGPARDMAANLVWSAKESALKVLRTGLRRDTRSVEVDVAGLSPPEHTWSALRVRTAEGEVFPGWWRRSGSFLVTACWPGGGPPPGPLEARSPIDTLLPSHRWIGRPVS